MLMLNRRKTIDVAYQVITYLAASIGVIALSMIIILKWRAK